MEDVNIKTLFLSFCKRIDFSKLSSLQLQRKIQSLLSNQISSSDCQLLLSVISSLLLEESYTLLVADYFSPILLKLLSHCKTSDDLYYKTSFTKHEVFGIALGKLIGKYSIISDFCVDYFENHPSLLERFEKNEESKCKRKKLDDDIHNDNLQKLLEATLQLLIHCSHFLCKIWNLKILIDLIHNSNLDIKWLSCICLAVITKMSNDQLNSFLKKNFNEDVIVEFKLKYMSLIQYLWEIKSNNTTKAIQNEVSNQKSHSQSDLIDFDCCADVVSVSGVLLRKNYSKMHNISTNLILVPSVKLTLKDLAFGIATGECILLQGPVGCGKTALVEYIAGVTGKNLIKVQLGDQIDSKLLLGSHCCTDIPGEFIWHPGPLTQAMSLGYWLLLEDIDYAPMDIISLIIPVLQSKSVILPGHAEPIKATSGFRLFATQRLIGTLGGHQSEFRNPSDMISKLWKKIVIESLSRDELEELITTKWPVLKSIINQMLDIYFMVSSGEHNNGIIKTLIPKSSSGRLISTRDLLKWCQRIIQDFDFKLTKSAITIFQDAMDCFCQHLSSNTERLNLAKSIGTKLNLTEAKIEYFCTKYKPEISFTSEMVKIGRVILKKKKQNIISGKRFSTIYAHTRQSVALLESIAVAVKNSEPVLLVGETGTGKTSIIQYLADLLGHKLTVINMNQQSDSVDLLGGYKPVKLKYLLAPLHREYEEIFCQSFSRIQNIKFLGHVSKCFSFQRWQDMFKLMLHTQQSAIQKYTSDKCNEETKQLIERWKKLGYRIHQLQSQVKQIEKTLAFSFIEGSLVKAIKEGEWILLDEINLAEAETLECLSGLLESSSSSVLITERGDTEPIKRHDDFCLFASMNPATDIGKKDLPPGIRNRFSEFYMEDLEDKEDLRILVNCYLKGLTLSAETINNIVKFYIQIRKDAENKYSDGTGHHPHYSLRTLCRALSYASRNPCYCVPRSLFEGFCLSFLTQLDRSSHPLVIKQIIQYILKKTQLSVLSQPIKQPEGKFVCFEGYWIQRGENNPNIPVNYILTPSVKQNLKDLARIVSAGRHPVLLQGETSVGKTSLIKWLAEASGNKCVRINNHEHSDLQEYVGNYSSDNEGKLFFKEGILVEAMKFGYWIILDELNLAPTEVLEALNRVLDDNRELYIPETQQIIKAHPQFMLFATQNPPGFYGGRKVLSRAFRNRFIELHFDEIPPAELQIILQKRCALPPSYSKRLIDVMQELQVRRRESGIFAGKHGYITLRDLFRWGERYRLAAQSENFYDWNEHLANEGYMLLAGRVRKKEEADVIQEVIEKCMHCKINPLKLFTSGNGIDCKISKIFYDLKNFNLPEEFKHIVWTSNMKRLAILVSQAMKFNEPVLLVGETGCGKTTICQLLSALEQKVLYSVNCHMHSESSDFLGGLRPVRHVKSDEDCQKLFEWVDGPLTLSMKSGNIFLADEISLADDSVLERLNSVLEPECTLLLAEKGSSDNNLGDIIVTAEKGFHFLATMNPGGDFGKKELSPALRNRFTEIWCPSTSEKEDIINIIKHNIKHPFIINDKKYKFAEIMMNFLDWFKTNDFGYRYSLSIRDILAWVNFINNSTNKNSCVVELHLAHAYVHGACLVILDSLGSGLTSDSNSQQIKNAYDLSLNFLQKQMEYFLNEKEFCSFSVKQNTTVVNNTQWFGIEPFYISVGLNKDCSLEGKYTLSSNTTKLNATRVLRAMYLPKPILLEGMPGVGKTSLVSSLAKASGNHLTRINLSEQTDISDLFGSDLPVEGKCGVFAWRDGPLLQALKTGSWILLDELNLASQSVLEGLNACLDHRGEIYIPELGKTFKIQQNRSYIFGCQNPYKQGGARKGLPKSFLNRFTQVYIQPMSSNDLFFISHTIFPSIPQHHLLNMINFNEKIIELTQVQKLWGEKGPSWEFNLRDIFRWCEALLFNQDKNNINPGEYVSLIYGDRMRTIPDKKKVLELYEKIFEDPVISHSLQLKVTSRTVQIGYSILPRQGNFPNFSPMFPLHYQLEPLQSLMKCIEMNWLTILISSSSVGKTSIVNLLATLTGQTLFILTVNSEMDTTELLGGFEQRDLTRHLDSVNQDLEKICKIVLWSIFSSEHNHLKTEIKYLFECWHFYHQLCSKVFSSRTNEEIKFFKSKIDVLWKITNCINKFLMIPNCFPENIDKELVLIKSKLTTIQESLKTSGVVSSGGRFEWVDSILVTAVKKGYWLLIDDVNLCSPSVLDRLNGLLEPNGVLTISEQGVIGEEIPTITPHPNFRLIFAMNPKNGEISSAMRNRGIEIYIPGEEDNYTFDNFDIFTMLQCKGMYDPVLSFNLLNVHRKIVKEYSDIQLEGPTILELLQTASACVQFLQYGYHPKNALTESCYNIYIKNIHNHFVKQKIEACFKELIPEITEFQYGTEFDSLSLPSLLPSILEFQMDPIIARLKQDGVLCRCLLKSIENHDKMETNEFLKDQLKNKIPLTADLLLYIVSRENQIYLISCIAKMFIETATSSDWKYRKLWILQQISLLKNKSEYFQDISNHLITVISKYLFDVFELPIMQELCNYIYSFSNSEKKINNFIDDDMLLDVRWNPSLQKKLLISFKEQPDIIIKYHSCANRFLMFLNYQVFKFIQNQRIHSVNRYNNEFSLINLSKAFKEGHITIRDLPHPFIQYVLSFLYELDDEIVSLLGHKNYFCKTVDMWKLFEAIRYCYYLNAVCCEFCTKHSIKNQIVLFTLHWYWMKKKVFLHLFNDTFSNESKDSNLKIIISDINRSLKINISGIHKLRSKITSHLNCCIPLKDEFAALVFIDLQRILSKLDIQNYINSDLKLTSLYLFGPLWIEKLLNCLNLFFNSTSKENTAKAKDLLKSIELDMEKNELFNNQSLKFINYKAENLKISSQELTANIQLLPMIDYLYIVIKQKHLFCKLNDVQKRLLPSKLFSEIENKYYKDISRINEDILCKMSKENILYPVEYINEYGILQKDNNSAYVLLNFYNHLNWNQKLISKFLTWQPCSLENLAEEDNDDIIKAVSSWQEEGTFMQPLRMFIVLMLQSNFDSSIFTIENFVEKSAQLSKINNLLWRNALDLCYSMPSFKYINAFITLSWFNCISWCLLSEMKNEDLQHINSLDELYSLILIIDLPFNILNIFKKTINSIKELYISLTEAEKISEFSLHWITGKASAYVGLLTSQLLAPNDIVDPIQKWKIKLHYYCKEYEEIVTELKIRNIYSQILTGMELNQDESHPVISYLLERQQFLDGKNKELKKRVIFRPENPQYEDLLHDINQFLSSVGSTNAVFSILEQLEYLKETYTFDNIKDSTKSKKVLQEIQRWQVSQANFTSKLQEKYLLYGDLINPFLTGLKQMAFGIQTSGNYISSRLFKLHFSQDFLAIEKFLIKMIEFPYISTSYINDLSPASFLSEETIISRLECLLNYIHKDKSFNAQNNIIKLIMSALFELKNEILVTSGDHYCKLRIFKILTIFLKQLFNVWQEQEAKQKLKEEEEESFYQYKTYHPDELTEEQQQLEIKTVFPSYENEFQIDLRDSSHLEQNSFPSADNITFSLKQQDMIDIWSIHATIISLLSNKFEFPYISEFYSVKSCDLRTCDYIHPFMLRYNIIQYLIKHIGCNLDSMIDGHTINSNLIGNFAIQKTFKQSHIECQNVKFFDIYHDPNPLESTECRILLKRLSEKIFDLLEQFPDHPTLKQIIKIANRILSFSITSPLMKFLTGLEIILTVSQDWEINSHKGVSLINELTEITDKIIKWRKLELRCWSECLDSIFNNEYKNSAKWWFYLYSIISPVIEEMNFKKEEWTVEMRENFVETLQKFIESSTIGQFRARIDLLYTFMEHIKHHSVSFSNDIIYNIISNVYYYYHQFLDFIDEKILAERKPIEKEIKEFVKIAKWNDINFWSVKQGIEKSHQTLHKYMKQFEKVLNHPAQSCLNFCKITDSEEKSNSWKFEPNFNDFISSSTLQEHLENIPNESEFRQHHYKKMRNICKRIYQTSEIVKQIHFLDDFAGEIISAIHELKSLDVSKDADLERRKKEVHNIHIRKQKALSDLFKTLASIGLSYKLGIIYWKDINIKNLLLLPFLDIKARLSEIPDERTGDKIWKESSNGIHKYFYRSVSKFFSLATALASPNKDLNADSIERCKGFIGHLMHLICNQLQDIKLNTKSLFKIRNLLNNLKNNADSIPKETETLLPPQDTLKEWMINVKNLVYHTSAILQQFMIILECCPTKTENSYVLVEPNYLPPLILANKNDIVWNQVFEKVDAILKTIQNLIKQFPKKSVNTLWTFKDYEFLSASFKTLMEISIHLKSLKTFIEIDGKKNNFSDSLNFILNEINRLESEFQKCNYQFKKKCLDSCSEKFSVINPFIALARKFNHHIFIAVQNTFLYYSKFKNECKEQENISIEEKVLTHGILNEIKDIMDKLNISKINKLSKKIEKYLKLIDSTKVNFEEANKIAFTISPFLDQYVNLVQFFIIEQTAAQRVLCKILYILLGTFTELAEQGFCLPPELLEETIEKKGDKFKDIEEGGLGEGQGIKDVSEKLESEDQLDEAQKPGENKEDKTEQPECEEEEHGVEMTDDFDGKLYDPSKTENTSDQSGDEDDDDEKLDKKMDEIDEEDVEKLDNEVWGGDSENEEELKDDDSGGGKRQSEKTVVAKNSEDEEVDDNDNKENKSKSEHQPSDFHDDEYDGENFNNINEKSDKTIENFELPDDLKIEEDTEIEEEEEMELDNMDINQENLHEEQDNMNENEEDNSLENIDSQEKNDGNINENEDQSDLKNIDSEKEENNKDNIEKEQESSVPENEKTDDKSLPSKNDSTMEISLPCENNNSSSHDKVLTVPESNENWNAGDQNAPEKEHHGEGFSDFNKYNEVSGQEMKNISQFGRMEEEISSAKRQLKPAENQRTLGIPEEKLSCVKTIESSNCQEEKNVEENQKSNLYEHIQDSNSDYDIQTIDTATEQQASKQNLITDDKINDSSEEMDTLSQDDDIEIAERENISGKSLSSISGKQNIADKKTDDNMEVDELPIENLGDITTTCNVARGPNSTIHTQYDLWTSLTQSKTLEQLRLRIEHKMVSWMESHKDESQKSQLARELWQQNTKIVLPFVQELCEQLRLVLEPTKVSKLKGDYRIGKRLNMRKIIPYIASQFRKDKIWLRRTKPSKREYQIMLAVDDSSSMNDNKSRQLAMESVTLLGKSLSLLEVGQISIVTFGEDVKLLHPFGEPFTDLSGIKIFQNFTFEQKRTRIAQLLNYATNLMIESRHGPISRLISKEIAQLLIILSDGRGIFNEGEECVRQAVRFARNNNIFLVFIILDNPENKNSILDIKVPKFKADQIEILSYMELFPFPFYIILQEINSMPLILGEALRQWFEMITSTEH